MGRHEGLARLGVDPVACEGIGICQHVAPMLVRADSWGYPIVSNRPLRGAARRAAEAAVASCPRRALFVDVPDRSRQVD
jgi:ferredoxin